MNALGSYSYERPLSHAHILNAQRGDYWPVPCGAAKRNGWLLRCILCRFLLSLIVVWSSVFEARQVKAQTTRAPAIVAVCAPCHGADGTTGNVETPNLAGQKAIYLRQQLLAFRDGRRKHPDMKTISWDLTEREINQLVVYYSTLISP